MSSFRVSPHSIGFSIAIIAALVTPAPDTPPTGLYALDEKISFNVLDAVTQDPASGQITLFGHKDLRFGEIKIPYLQHLATLLESPAPEFSLESTSASSAQVDAMFRRFDDPQQMAGMAFAWGKMFDQNGQPTAAGRYFLPLLGIKPLTGSWTGVDQFGRIGAVYRAVGNETGAETIELYGKFQNEAQNGGEFSNAMLELIQVAGKGRELDDIRRRVRQGQLTEGQQIDVAMRLVAESLDSGLGLKGAPATASYDKARARGTPPAKAYDSNVVPVVNDQLQIVGHDILESLFDRVGEIQIPADVLAETAGVARPEVVPTYLGIDPHSQLARLFFEADYLGKSLMNKPELSDKIPAYQTMFAFERGHPSISASRAKQLGSRGVTSHCRFWFTADKIDLTETADHKALATGAAKMRINFAEKGVNSGDSDCTREYGELLTKHYDELAQQFPTLHELQEAAKLAGVAQWLKKQQPELRLVREGRSRWTGPDRVAGFVFLTWSSRPPQPGAPAISAMATGGVSLKLDPTAAIPAKGSVDVVAIENCPDIAAPSSGAPIGWTTGPTEANQQEQILTISTKAGSSSDGRFLTPSPTGYTVLWSQTAVSTPFLSAACRQVSKKQTLATVNSAQPLYADLSDELKPIPTKNADSKVGATNNSGGSRLLDMPPPAAELINALQKVSAKPIFNVPQRGKMTKSPLPNQPLPKGPPLDRDLVDNNCQTLFRALGEELAARNIESWNKEFPWKDFGNPMADGIVAQIDRDSVPGGKWEKLTTWEEAQDLANRGGIVIGGLRAKPVEGRTHGHLEVVVSMPPGTNLSSFGGTTGPLVRDGNEHPNVGHHFGLSTWGTVRASRTMTPTEFKDMHWYVWVPSKPSPMKEPLRVMP